MTVTSGRQCATLSRKTGPLGSLVKMCLESSRWNSTIVALTWKTKVTKFNRLLFQLAPSMPDTGEIESGLLPTPCKAAEAPNLGSNKVNGPKSLIAAARLMPTPTSRDGKDGKVNSCKNVKVNGLLGRAVHLMATPHANCANGIGSHGTGADNLQTQVGGSLNPEFVEWLMGYPIGYTALNPSATQSFHKSRKSSVK